MKKAFIPWEVPHARCDASIVTKAHAMTKDGKQNNPHLQATRVQCVHFQRETNVFCHASDVVALKATRVLVVIVVSSVQPSCGHAYLEVKGTQEKLATDHLSQKCFISPNHDLSTKYPEPLSMVYNYITITRNIENGPILCRFN